MHYVSTRGEADTVTFEQACLAGLAPDGGLYTPETWPQIKLPEGRISYTDAAKVILKAFTGDSLSEAELGTCVDKAYASFAHDSVTPLTQIGADKWMLELHHGPTLAFKDVAMQVIAQIYDVLLSRSGKRLTILCATSGDTGGAAAAAFAGAENVDLFILHPKGRVSPVQRRFMTSTGASNIHNFEIEGDFDDTQAIVKSLFGDANFRDSVHLSGVNSINWTRIAAQSVYFVMAQRELGTDRPLRFVVPTGNFGDALAAYVAARCGLLNGLDVVTAINSNKAMADLLGEGKLSKKGADATLSPAMDIALPSNAERLLFEVSGRRADEVRAFYGRYQQAGVTELDARTKGALGCVGIEALSISDDETADEMKKMLGETDWLICPHTAVGTAAAKRINTELTDVILSTAHAAKFPETVLDVTGRPAPLPSRCEAFLGDTEVFETFPADLALVRQQIMDRTRAC